MASLATFLSSSLGIVNSEVRSLAQTKVDAMRAASSVIVGALVLLTGVAFLLVALFVALQHAWGTAGAASVTGLVASLVGAGVLVFSRRMRVR